jgi:Tol biopolymer transport system component
MQVFIYSADGKLLNVATSVARSDSNTTFWSGAGTYILKVKSDGGDWKLDVQDLH